MFFLVYQQLENHILQPLIYGKTAGLSPLAVLIAVLIGAALAGVIGALAAIPIAGNIQVVIRDLMRERAERKQADRPDHRGRVCPRGSALSPRYPVRTRL